VVRFANVVGVVDVVLFVDVAGLLETSLPEVGRVVVVGGVVSGSCAKEEVGEKERERRKRESV
jgi:hypothetical protein